MKVNEHNVVECWKYYEIYLEEEKKTHYSDAKLQDFVEWCEEELFECPNCGTIVRKDYQELLFEPLNTDEVCDDCMQDGYYG